MAFEFIHEIAESRLTRNGYSQKTLTYNDCKERAFLIKLMIHVMRHYKSYKIPAGKYAYKTVMYRDYTRFRVDSTDLYNLFYFITGDENALGKLKDPDGAAIERKKTFISVGKLNGYLRSTGSYDSVGTSINRIIELERELGIKNSDYKQIRRRLATFDTDTYSERQTTVTRLLFAGRSKLSNSDFLQEFTKLAIDKNLEDMTKTGPEFQPSVPDAASEQRVENYRFLVPVSRLPYIANFLQQAKGGRAVVANFMQAYLPIVLMVDDIVRAGPAYVNQLKQLHSRAKRNKSAK